MKDYHDVGAIRVTVPLGAMCAYRRLTMRLQEVKLTSKSSGPFPREGATPYGYESGHVAPGECGIDSIAVGVFENVDGDCDCVLASRESLLEVLKGLSGQVVALFCKNAASDGSHPPLTAFAGRFSRPTYAHGRVLSSGSHSVGRVQVRKGGFPTEAVVCPDFSRDCLPEVIK